MMRQAIRINFVVAVWLTIAYCAVFLLAATAGDFGLLESARPPIGIALLGVFELALWFVWYRHGEGRTAAAIVGVLLLEPAVAALLLPQVTDQPTDKRRLPSACTWRHRTSCGRPAASRCGPSGRRNCRLVPVHAQGERS